MRLPVRRIYRYFPELDGFSDEDCERFVRQVGRISPLLAAIWVVSSVGTVVVGTALIWFGVQAIPDQWLAGHGGSTMVGVSIAFALLLAALGGGLMWVAVLTRNALLIRAVRLRLRFATCPDCRHSLLGLPLLSPDGRETVRCPECGRIVVLDDIGLTHAELIPRSSAPAPELQGQ